MSTDIYAAYSGALAAWRNLEMVSGNIANANTTGFREQRMRFEDTLGAVQATQGGYKSTDGPLVTDNVDTHFAIRGDGFFALGDGTFTRDGTFRLDPDGRLTTKDGAPVLGEGGAITVERGERLTVGTDGTVTGSASGDIGKLRLVTLAGATPVGENRWTGAPGAGSVATVVQGALEGSNVDPMRCMVELVEASRAFEAQQKVMQSSDEARSRLNQMQG